MRVSVGLMSLLCVCVCNLYGEGITEENAGYFQASNAVKAEPVTPPTSPIVQTPAPKATPTPPGGTMVTPPSSNVPLTLESDGIWRDTADLVLTKQSSHHAFSSQMIDGNIPVYTWSSWGFGSEVNEQTANNVDGFINVQP